MQVIITDKCQMIFITWDRQSPGYIHHVMMSHFQLLTTHGEHILPIVNLGRGYVSPKGGQILLQNVDILSHCHILGVTIITCAPDTNTTKSCWLQTLTVPLATLDAKRHGILSNLENFESQKYINYVFWSLKFSSKNQFLR